MAFNELFGRALAEEFPTASAFDLEFGKDDFADYYTVITVYFPETVQPDVWIPACGRLARVVRDLWYVYPPDEATPEHVLHGPGSVAFALAVKDE